MNTYWLAIGLSLVLPLLPLVNAICLLRRAVRPVKTHFFALAASGMVFTLCLFWLAKSAKLLWKIYQGDQSLEVYEHLMTNLTQGPYLAFSLVVLSGGFWIWLAWKQRLNTVK